MPLALDTSYCLANKAARHRWRSIYPHKTVREFHQCRDSAHKDLLTISPIFEARNHGPAGFFQLAYDKFGLTRS